MDGTRGNQFEEQTETKKLLGAKGRIQQTQHRSEDSILDVATPAAQGCSG